MVIDDNKKIICTDFSLDNRHDFRLLQDSKLQINQNIQIFVDSGYIGIRKIYTKNIIKIPIKRTKKHKLTKKDKRYNRELSKTRIKVEHINAEIKRFKILGTKYRNKRKKFTLRFNLICALINCDRFGV